MALIWATLLSALLIFLLVQKFLTKKKKLPPASAGLPILGHLHLLRKNHHLVLRDLARKHGPIMGLRLGLVPAVVVSSPAAAQLILRTHDLVFASRPSLHASQYMGYGQRGVIFAPYGPYWRDMRKLCTSKLLSGQRINQFQAMRKGELLLLVESLKHAAERREVVDLSSKILASIGDMICLMVFGRKLVNSDIDETGFKAVIAETVEITATFNLADCFPYVGLLDLQGLNHRMKRVSKIFDRFLERIIDDHVQKEQGKKKTGDFVDIMMGILKSGEAEFEFDRRHVKAVLLDLLLAGMDTSATTVDWAISELIRHPQAMKKLQRELESVVELGHIVEESHLDKLEYLDFVLKETLRLHPATPLLVPHESIEDCIVDGFHIAKESRVLVNIWAIGRDPTVWLNPEAFVPERFIGSNIDLKGHDFQLIPFGSGRRICPGMQLGLTLVKSVLAILVHLFDWELPNASKPSELDMTEHFGVVMCRAKHLKAIPTYRSCK